MRRSWSTQFLPLLLFALASCGDDPTSPVLSSDDPPALESASPSDGAGAPIDPLLAGSFTFKSPLPEQSLTSAFDPGVLPALTVEVCLPASCGVVTAARYTSLTGPGSETIRIGTTNDMFVVNFKPSDSKLGPAIYRIRVLAAGLVLGQVDVRLYRSGNPVAAPAAITLQEKSTLLVKFVVGRNPVIAALMAKANGATASDVAALLVAQFGSSAHDVAVILAHAGFAPGDIATALRTKLAQSAAQTAALLTSLGLVSNAVQLTSALVTGGYPVADILAVLRDAGQSVVQAATTARSAGIAVADVGNALGSVFGVTQSAVHAALRQAGYTAAEVGAWLVANGGDVTTVAGQLRAAGYAIDDVVAFIKATGTTDAAAIAAILKAAGFTLTELASWLTTGGLTSAQAAAVLKTLGYSIAEVGAWLDAAGLSDAAIATALGQAGWTVAEVTAYFASAGNTPASIVVILKAAGITAYDIAAALVTELEKTEAEVGVLLKGAGFDAEASFDALYRVSREVLANPVDFALRVAVAAMKGAGYFFHNFKDHLVDGIHEWTEEHLIDALGLSGYSIPEITDFMLNVMNVTAERLMEKAKAWGVPLPEITAALVTAGAKVDAIVTGAIAAYNATAETMAQALKDANAAADDVAAALITEYNKTLDQTVAVLQDVGYLAGVAFDASYRAARNVLNHPVDFALNLTLAAMRGAGYFFDNFKDHLVGGIKEWTKENLIDALGLSGFSIAELSDFMLNVLDLTAQQVAERARSWGVPVDDLIDALDDAGEAMSDIVAAAANAYNLTADQLADAMHDAGKAVGEFADELMSFYNITEDAVARSLQKAGYLIDSVGDWVMAKLSNSGSLVLERATDILTQAGYNFDKVADWAWAKSGQAADKFAAALEYAGHKADAVADYLKNKIGLGAERIFEVLQQAGYAAADVAKAVAEKAGASLTDIGKWLFDYYELTVDVTVGILKGLNASLADLINVMINVYSTTLADATSILLALNYTIAEILALWPGL